VHITVNKVGPFANPHETYRYYDLPFCHQTAGFTTGEIGAETEEIVGGTKHKQKLGEALAGEC